MRIQLTKHFSERCHQRTNHDEGYIIRTFEWLMKKVKHGELIPKPSEGKFVLKYKEFKYVYAVEDKTYIIITFAIREAG